MNSNPYYPPNLESILAGAIDEFEDEVDNRYALASDARTPRIVAKGIVDVLRGRVNDLSDSKSTDLWKHFGDRLSTIGMQEDVRFALEASLAREVINTGAMATRCLELVSLIGRSMPPESVLRFVRRTSRCYILGLFPECLVMCRAGFENSLNAKYQQEDAQYPRDRHGQATMRERVNFAVERGWLEADLGRRALQVVWGRGSKAAHEDPGAVGSPLEAIQLTMQVVEQLHAVPDEPAL